MIDEKPPVAPGSESDQTEVQPGTDTSEAPAAEEAAAQTETNTSDEEEGELSALSRRVRELAHHCGIAVEDMGVVRSAHALIGDVHNYFGGVSQMLEDSLKRETSAKTQLAGAQAAIKSFTEARAPFPDGIYDHKLTERREQFLNGQLVFAVSAGLLDKLGPTALPHQYRGTWGSFKDVPQG